MKFLTEILDFLGGVAVGIPVLVLYSYSPESITTEAITGCALGLAGMSYLVLRVISLRDRLEILNERIQANEYPGV